jgi:hypothetical protein
MRLSWRHARTSAVLHNSQSIASPFIVATNTTFATTTTTSVMMMMKGVACTTTALLLLLCPSVVTGFSPVVQRKSHHAISYVFSFSIMSLFVGIFFGLVACLTDE